MKGCRSETEPRNTGDIEVVGRVRLLHGVYGGMGRWWEQEKPSGFGKQRDPLMG